VNSHVLLGVEKRSLGNY